MIAGTTLQSLGSILPRHKAVGKASLEQWVRRLETKGWKASDPTCRLHWTDIWNTWDVSPHCEPFLAAFPTYVASDYFAEGAFSAEPELQSLNWNPFSIAAT